MTITAAAPEPSTDLDPEPATGAECATGPELSGEPGHAHSGEPGHAHSGERGCECWDHTRTAAELGVTPETLYVWVNAGSGPPSHRKGRRRRYRPADVRAYRHALAERFP